MSRLSAVPRLQNPTQLMHWASDVERLLKRGSGNIEGDRVTVAQITTNQNDYPLDPGTLFRLSSSGSVVITGFSKGYQGRVVVLANVGSNSIVLANQSVSSQPRNRILTGTGGNFTLSPNQSVPITYDDQTGSWRVIGSVTGGTSGTVPTEYDPPVGARPGTVFTVSPAPSILQVRHGNVPQTHVGAAPGVNQFTLSGTTLTMGNTVQAGDDFYALGFV